MAALPPKPYMNIVAHYEACFERYGDTPRGMDWPVAEDVPVRHRVMLDVARERLGEETVELLDFGCGTSGLYEYIRERELDIAYTGLDISPVFIERAQAKFPGVRYHCLDILDTDVAVPTFDYVVLNGVFTEKRELSFSEMFNYVQRVLERVFALAKVGIAFNVMSKHVDWERDDLFHLPYDVLAEFLTARLSRNIVFRGDYGLYEYTTYVYR